MHHKIYLTFAANHSSLHADELSLSAYREELGRCTGNVTRSTLYTPLCKPIKQPRQQHTSTCGSMLCGSGFATFCSYRMQQPTFNSALVPKLHNSKLLSCLSALSNQQNFKKTLEAWFTYLQGIEASHVVHVWCFIVTLVLFPSGFCQANTISTMYS